MSVYAGIDLEKMEPIPPSIIYCPKCNGKLRGKIENCQVVATCGCGFEKRGHEVRYEIDSVFLMSVLF